MRPLTVASARPARALALPLALPLALALLVAAPPHAAHAQGRYLQTNLVSDVPGLARTLDPNLKNPWGIALGATSPFWVANAGTGTSTLYDGSGLKVPLTVTIPGPGGPVPSVPTGTVFNGTGGFALSNGRPPLFVFASATGTISGWNPEAGTEAIPLVNAFGAGAAYTGIAVAGTGGDARLYAANAGQGRIDVWDAAMNPVVGGFVDPELPAGYVPFNVQHAGGHVYVSYALIDPLTGQARAGAGNGIVTVFGVDGAFERRLATGGALDAPWGFALAPSTFGRFGGALLVGNFGDGTILGYDPEDGTYLGRVRGADGRALVNEGLWGITFGNGAAGGDRDKLYFAAGINGERNGLFGSIQTSTVPEPSTVTLLLAGLGATFGVAARRRRQPR